MLILFCIIKQWKHSCRESTILGCVLHTHLVSFAVYSFVLLQHTCTLAVTTELAKELLHVCFQVRREVTLSHPAVVVTVRTRFGVLHK